MKIEQIFAGVYVMRYSGEPNEFRRLMNLWKDIAYLAGFFEAHRFDLVVASNQYISIEDAIFETVDEAVALQMKIYHLATKEDAEGLERLFRPLHVRLDRDGYFSERKAYGVKRKSWLRLYALKTIDGAYLITGGAIKLTKGMQERVHTANEIKKMSRCKAFLKEQGIYDQHGLIEMEL